MSSASSSHLLWWETLQKTTAIISLGLCYWSKWSEVAQSCPTLCDPMNRSLPGSSVHGILQARILEWVAISFSRVSSQRRDRTPGLPHCGQTLPSESPGKPYWSTSPNKSLWLEEMSHSLTQRLLENPTYSNSLLCNFCVFHVKLEPQCVSVCVCGAKLTTTKSSSPSPRSWKSPTLPECNHNHHTFNFRLDETLYCCHFFYLFDSGSSSKSPGLSTL